MVILAPNYFLLEHMETGFVQEVNCLLESMLPRFISYNNLYLLDLQIVYKNLCLSTLTSYSNDY